MHTLAALVTVVTVEALHARGGAPGPPSSQCYTRVATTPAGHGLSTDWHTSYTFCTVTSTRTVTTTITPTYAFCGILSSTYSRRSYATSLQTFGTLANDEIGASRSTVTSTVTQTSTVSTASTVAAPATFTPVQSSLPGSTYSGSGGPDPVGKREVNNNAPVKRASSNKLSLVPQVGYRRYPQGVFCHRWTHK
jgi:hypothetical protein